MHEPGPDADGGNSACDEGPGHRYRDITAALMAWYGVHRRELPWRNTKDPYRIWVAEIMLQQTRVATAIRYYERFLARFPTLSALASAELDEVMAIWQGLGYYSRARNLHATARIVQREHNGVIPATHAELLRLPGIGEYTAGALLSMAFGQDAVAIDSNVTRILCRVFNYSGNPSSAAGRHVLRAHAEALKPSGEAGAFSQALMDLGSAVCVARSPRSDICPIAAYCEAHALGIERERPIPRPRRSVPHRSLAAAFVEADKRLLIVRLRPKGLLGGLWEIPNGPVAPDEAPDEAVARHLWSLGAESQVSESVGLVQHEYSHLRVTVHVYRCHIRGELEAKAPWNAINWLSVSELSAYGLTGVSTRAIQLAGWPTHCQDGA